MKLNCKPGDLAVIVRSAAKNEGKIVTCVRLASEAEVRAFSYPVQEAVWIIDRAIISNWGRRVSLCQDSLLRPIRPQSDDATDETLLWLPVPHKEVA